MADKMECQTNLIIITLYDIVKKVKAVRNVREFFFTIGVKTCYIRGSQHGL